MGSYFTSESVTRGHPDKVCDQIADAILDEILKKDPYAHVACKVAALTDCVHIMGEITSGYSPDYEKIARRVIEDIGYNEPERGFDAKSCRVDVSVHEQSPDIRIGLNRRSEQDTGAGDQGMMFGYACDETVSLMPLPIVLAHALARRLEYTRRSGLMPCLLPDGKAQVTLEYVNGEAKRVSTVVLSAQHREGTDIDTLRSQLTENVICHALPAQMLDDDTLIFINPTGRFVIGGPAGDTGLSGRKVISDTYGGSARNGGGALSGKDATKMDRSGAYMARYIAKNIIKSGAAKRCEVQLAYAIGLSDPVSVSVNTFGTGKVPEERLESWVCEKVDMRPAMIIRGFNLRSPVYEKLSCYGHFGENAAGMPWEETDIADRIRSDLLEHKSFPE